MTQFWTVQHVTKTTSTNADLAQLALDGAPEGTALVADHQEAGRGRLGRTWHTPAGLALTVSFLLRPASVPSSRWSWLPLLTGVAVVDAVAQMAPNPTDRGAELKWPNDVLIGERKLAGILVERVDTDHGPAAVVGVGLNVLQKADDLPPTATSLTVAGAGNVTREAALAAVSEHLAEIYAIWIAADGDPKAGAAAAYLKRCGTIGRHVTAMLPGGSKLNGKAVDIDELGRLVVAGDTGRHAVGAGDIVHLR
jgi:BirA family biotin operon repressor/biotin-[acetyl-CoA-carboxylase] ligase